MTIYRLFGAAIAFGAGIIWADRVGSAINLWAVFFLLFMCVSYGAYRRSCIRWCLIGGILFLLGAGRLFFAVSTYEALFPMQGHDVTLTGIVADKGSLYQGEEGNFARYQVESSSFLYSDDPSHGGAGAGVVYVTVPAKTVDKGPFLPGDAIEVIGRVEPLRYYRNQGLYDARHRDMRLGITGRMYPKDRDVRLISSGAQTMLARLESLKSTLTERYQQGMHDGRAYLLSSLLFGGNYNLIPPEVLHSFAVTGIIHILSVSGSHVALLFGMVYWLGRRLRLSPKVLFVFGAVTVLFYAALSGFSSPIVRSAFMGIMAALGLVLKRENSGISALGATVLVMLVVSPLLVFDLSFQLSVGATAGIVLYYQRLCRSMKCLPAYLRSLFAITISAQVLIVPLLLYNFQALPLYSIIANVLVTPLLEVMIIGGLVASLLSFAAPAIALVLLPLLDRILSLALQVNQFLAGLPGARLELPPLATFWAGSYYAVLLWWHGDPYIGKQWPTYTFERFGRWLVISWCLGSLLSPLLFSPDMTVYKLDAGKDEATLFRSRAGYSLLCYDTSKWSSPIMIESVIVPALRFQGVFALDALVLYGGKENPKALDHFFKALPIRSMIVTSRQVKENYDTLIEIPSLALFTADEVRLDNLIIRQTIDGGSLRVLSKESAYYIYYGDNFPAETVYNQDLVELRRPTTVAANVLTTVTGLRGLLYQSSQQAFSSSAGADLGENAALMEIPAFDSHRDGEIKASLKNGRWQIQLVGKS